MSAAYENPENTAQENNSGHGAGWKGLLIAALVIALGGNIYLLKRSADQNDRMTQMQTASEDQINKLTAAAQAAQEDSRRQLATLTDSLTGFNSAATAAVARARAEGKKAADQLQQKLDEAQQSAATELSQVKEEAAAKLNEVSTDVSGVKTDVSGVKTDVDGVKTNLATAQTALEDHTAQLKRMVGDMGSMSGLIATNAKDLATLRELGERNYYEFTINKGKMSTKAGGLVLTLKKADPKASRYTLDVMADDKHVEKRDRTINEPVQIYVSGAHIPAEIVVNKVNKDQVVGYVSTPKVQLSQR